jgi:hypothetical protein
MGIPVTWCCVIVTVIPASVAAATTLANADVNPATVGVVTPAAVAAVGFTDTAAAAAVIICPVCASVSSDGTSYES